MGNLDTAMLIGRHLLLGVCEGLLLGDQNFPALRMISTSPHRHSGEGRNPCFVLAIDYGLRRNDSLRF
jgi:sigma54-dependent transcription regulator